MGQKRIKRRRVFIHVEDWSPENLAKDYLASYRVVSADEDDLTPISFLLFKYATLENARFLARRKAKCYEFLLCFLSDAERGRAQQNIAAAFETDEDDAPPIEPVLSPDLKGWQPFGRVLPVTVSDGVVLLASNDSDMIEQQHLDILKRQERDPDGDYVLPNLTAEETEFWRQVRDRKSQ